MTCTSHSPRSTGYVKWICSCNVGNFLIQIYLLHITNGKVFNVNIYLLPLETHKGRWMKPLNAVFQNWISVNRLLQWQLQILAGLCCVTLFEKLFQNKNSDFCAPLTSFDWNEVDPNLIGTSSIDTTCTIWGLETGQVSCMSFCWHRNLHVWVTVYCFWKSSKEYMSEKNCHMSTLLNL